MRSSVRMAWTLAMILGAGVGIAACESDGTTNPTPDPTQVRVTVRVDGTGESGLTVSIFSSGGTTALEQEETAANGQVTFEVDPGTYDVETEIPAETELDEGETARKSVTVAEGSTGTVTFDLVTEGAANVEVVTLNPSSFSPSAVTIATGETVRWVNGGSISHTVTPDGHSEWQSVSMTTSGQTFEHTFNTAGEYDYLCQLHAGMTGTVTVN